MRCLVAVIALSATLSAQNPEPRFEVVSIKRTKAIERGGGSSRLQPGGRFVMTNGPVRVLLGWAYGAAPNGEIVGAPDWVTYENYDIEARAGRELSVAEVAPLMRDLLATRFNLRVHMERQVRQLYELRVARADGRFGPNMRSSTIDCESRADACSTRAGLGSGLIESNGISMTRFATWLPALVGRPVVDKTNLSGYYAVAVKYSTSDTDNLPALPTALREELGLTLHPVNAELDVLVIDHIERPSEN